ncbi:MAG: glycine betaine ABC transporter substrate-binding protein [Planctomycetaceae bacterium]|nr:glycine betaine ABC transporter substrate-binding protein [Planctomycetaceae bacterium]
MSRKLTIGVTDLSFHRLTAALVSHVLQDMGFEVERVFSHHEDNVRKLQAGETDLLVSAWLPSSHGGYRADVEQTVPLIELGLHYEPYALWGVPGYVPESEVSQVADLLQPDVLAKMRKDIQGINPGAGISRFSVKMIAEYGLGDAGYQFHHGSEDDCFGTFERAVAAGDWLVVPLWKPQFLHARYEIRELKDPKGLLGVVDKAVLLLRADRESLFTAEQLAKLDSLRFGNDIIARLDDEVCRENRPIDQVTREWLDAD